MSRKVLTDLNLNQNEIQNVAIQNLASAPSSPIKGQIYYNTTTNKYMGYDGTEWLDLSSQGKIYTFSTGLTETSGTVILNQATGSALGGVIVGSNISVSSGTISVADASTSTKGVIEIATDTEASTGTDTTRAINAKQLATKVTANTAITGATHTKITYDSKGLVTAGADLSASDIPSLTLSKISDVTATASEVNVLDGITATTDELNILDGVTATATELNVLDGITASTTELNYVDGVTSSIQTQLNNKVAANDAITGATHTKITYDSKGLVTGGTSLSASDIPSLTLSKISDVTATASELNVLDGITATTTELNYVDGVTSSIQTQLNNKVASNAAITGGTHTKITYDSKGLVTGGSSLAASDIPDISATYVTVASKGQANGVASLDGDGKVPSSQLPSYVDDVVEAYIVSGSTALSAGWLSKTSGGSALTPETGVIYVVMTSGEYQNKTFRWGGTTYVEISSAPGQATESTAGIAAIATTAQVEAGTNDQTIITPAKLAAAISGMATTHTYSNPALTVSSGVCTWTITNTYGPFSMWMIKDASTGEEVVCDITHNSGNVVIKINSTSNIAANTYKAMAVY